MIKLFRSTETDFTHNEWVLSECISCKITEEINSDFTLELEYPLEDTKYSSKYLVEEAIIQAQVPDGRQDQKFRIIYAENTDTSKIVKCQAKLLADLKTNRVKAMTLTGLTRNEAIQYVLDNTLEVTNYNVGTLDNSTNRNVIVSIPEGNALSAIIGSENSILSEYGGEFIVDNDTICIVDSRGTESNTSIEYGKNITGIKETTDITDLSTVLIPKIGDLRLPEYYIKSDLANSYSKLYWNELDIQGITVKEDDSDTTTGAITKEEAYVKMREACNKSFNTDHVDMINHNYEVDFISLRKTEEYKNNELNVLEDVYIGNTSIVKHKILNLDLEGRVNKVVYDVLLDNLETVSFGFNKQDITDIINNTIRTIKFTEQSILLQVSNLDNTLTSKIEMTAEQIQSTVTDVKNGLQSQITQTATEIRSEVANADAGLNSKIDQTASSITSTITDTKNNLQSQITQTASSLTSTINNTNDNLQSQINQQADEIDLKVSKGSDFASEIKQQADAVTIAIKNQTNMNVTFDSNGQTIQNGALIIKDSNGNTIMQFKDGVVWAKDLDMRNGNATNKGSIFYNTLSNMEEVSLLSLKAANAVIPDNTYISGFGGTLEEYIKHIVTNM